MRAQTGGVRSRWPLDNHLCPAFTRRRFDRKARAFRPIRGRRRHDRRRESLSCCRFGGHPLYSRRRSAHHRRPGDQRTHYAPVGIRSVKQVVPPFEQTSSVPPCALAISEQIYRPKPRPSRLPRTLPRKNGWKSRSKRRRFNVILRHCRLRAQADRLRRERARE